MPKKFSEFIIESNPFLPDAISSLLWELNISGIEEGENNLKVFSEESSLVTKKEISIQLEKLRAQNLIENYKILTEEIEEKNWNEEWEKNLNVIHISDKIIIKPSFREYTPESNQIVITIDPKMAFGTGEHQTTKLILLSLEKYIKKNETVLDVGSGTGILGIASVKLGAKKVIGIDNDEWCFENAKENIITNNVEDKVEIRFGEIKDIKENNFDLIIANILKNILLEIAEEIKKRLKKNGKVILSGLLHEDESAILDQYKKLGFKLIEINNIDEWISITFELS